MIVELLAIIGVLLQALAHWMPPLTLIGVFLTMVAAIIVVVKRRPLNLRPYKVLALVGVLTLLMMLSPGEPASKLFALSLLGLYVVYHNVSNKATLPLAAFVLVEVVSLLVWHDRLGGLVHNRNIAAGVLVMGALLCRFKHQWVFTIIVVVGLFFTGAEEAILGLGALLVVPTLAKDYRSWSIVLATLGLCLVVATPLGITNALWRSLPARIGLLVHAQSEAQVDEAFTYRLDDPSIAVTNIEPLGHGYQPFNVLPETIHNVPLRALYETGPLAMLVWLVLVFYVVIKTRSFSAGLAIVILASFDHFLWTTLSPLLYMVLAGALAGTLPTTLYKHIPKVSLEEVRYVRRTQATNNPSQDFQRL